MSDDLEDDLKVEPCCIACGEPCGWDAVCECGEGEDDIFNNSPDNNNPTSENVV